MKTIHIAPLYLRTNREETSTPATDGTVSQSGQDGVPTSHTWMGLLPGQDKMVASTPGQTGQGYPFPPEEAGQQSEFLLAGGMRSQRAFIFFIIQSCYLNFVLFVEQAI